MRNGYRFHSALLYLTAITLVAAAFSVRVTAQEKQRPNIIMIVPHDLGQHLGSYGVEEVRTPNIDRLASRGVRFSNVYSTSGVCTPGRASLHTGRYPQSNGLMGLSHAPWWWELNEDEKHTAQYLKELGYETHLVGLSHLGESPDRLGYDHRHASGREPEKVVKWTENLISTKRKKDPPFFAKVGFHDVHRPFQQGPDRNNGVYVPPWLKGTKKMKTDLARFQGEIHYLDALVGRIMKTLNRSEISENTLVIFTAEHGIPYPGAKWTARKAGLEVPYIAFQPGTDFSGGKVFDQLMSNVDVLPTLLDYLGARIPDRIQGTSFMGLIRGETDKGPRKYAYGQYTRDMKRDNESRTVITRKHQLIWYASQGRSVDYPVFVDPHEFAQHRERARTANRHRPFFQLYDLENDPAELHNVASNRPEVVDRLKNKLRGWMKRVEDPLLDGPMPKPYYKRARDRLKNN